jgi:hypothetical protein
MTHATRNTVPFGWRVAYLVVARAGADGCRRAGGGRGGGGRRRAGRPGSACAAQLAMGEKIRMGCPCYCYSGMERFPFCPICPCTDSVDALICFPPAPGPGCGGTPRVTVTCQARFGRTPHLRQASGLRTRAIRARRSGFRRSGKLSQRVAANRQFGASTWTESLVGR